MEFFATSNNIPVHINDSKKGEITILLLHGYLETLYVFNELSESLEKKFRVISIDLPGHGLSGSAPEVNTMEFCSQVALGVLDKCNVSGDVYVAGHSMGGYVAQQIVKDWMNEPSGWKFNMKGLVLLNSVPYADSEEKKQAREHEIELIGKEMLDSIAEISIPKMYKAENLRKFDEKIIETQEICETHDPAGICASIRGMMQRCDYSDFIKKISSEGLKVLFVHGDSDKFNPIERIQTIKDEFANVRTEILKESGHNSFIEAEDSLLCVLADFLG